MFIDIEQIYTYGRFYPEIKKHVNWWICITDYVIYDTETIVSNFGYADEKLIDADGIFVPLFKTDMIELEKEFMQTIPLGNRTDPFPYDDIPNFDRNFKIYIENHFLIRDWYDFEKRHLCNDAIEWCKLHNFRFH